MLKVGQLAKQTQLSVRTLHHYDEIGLLSPSARTASGHRLYNTKDIAVLHRIQALKQFGFSLQDIADILRGNTLPTADIIQQQIDTLDEEINQAQALKQQLLKLQHRINNHRQPEARDWLDTLALMSIYQRYFTPQQIARMEEVAETHRQIIEKDLPNLVQQFNALIEQEIPSDDERSLTAAMRWLTLVETLVDKDPDLLVKLDTMTRNEKELQHYNGITPSILNYIYGCVSAIHKSIHAKYLTKAEMDRVYARPQKYSAFWPELIAEIRKQMNAGAAPDSDAMRLLAYKWQKSLNKNIFQDPTIAEKLRTAYMQEPLLTRSTGMDAAFFQFIRKAINALPNNSVSPENT